jgi:flavin reductase (DIM6/NTAB) family NADH-FMN oxidoreductase RutF
MKRPWNLIDAPVYSLLTQVDGRPNMNICTYVSAVSMQPKQYAVAVFHGSHTQGGVQQGAPVILQLLAADQYGLVRSLGHRSGRDTDKLAPLHKRGLLGDWQGQPILREAVALIQLEPLAMLPAGDHDLWLMEVRRHIVQRDAAPLTLDELRRRKLIRA